MNRWLARAALLLIAAVFTFVGQSFRITLGHGALWTGVHPTVLNFTAACVTVGLLVITGVAAVVLTVHGIIWLVKQATA